MHTTTGTEVPGEVVLNNEAIKLAEKANTIYASLYDVPGDFSQRSLDTRTKERPTNKDLANKNMVVLNVMDKRRANQNAFQVLWVVNCIVYSVVTAFLLLKEQKKNPNIVTHEVKMTKTSKKITCGKPTKYEEKYLLQKLSLRE